MNRRQFLASSAVLSLSGCKLSFEQGVFNDCISPRGHAAMRDPRIAAAWEGLRPDRVWDTHTHLFGNGKSGQGIWMSPEYDSVTSLASRARRTFFANAGCVGNDEATWDQMMVRRIAELVDELPAGAKVMLLAFDYGHDESGKRREDYTAFHIPNEYAMKVAKSKPDRFEWIASIHPYRPDAVEALEKAKAGGARAVKWLPPAMGIDPASKKCLPFFEAARRLDVPLLIHVGEEQAVGGALQHEFGNPLRLRYPLEQGVRVIAAHCATLGGSPDIDAQPNPAKARKLDNFELFTRLMGEKRYEGLLFGDIAAVTQVNRADYLPRLLENRDWHPRLLNGSDYPLPGIMPLFSIANFVRDGLLAEEALPAIKALRDVDSFAFDFVLKRNLRYKGAGFADGVFETRDFFTHGRT